MAYLCKGVASLGCRKAAAKDATGAPPSRHPHGGSPDPAWRCVHRPRGDPQISSGHDGGYYFYYPALGNGLPFWMGSLFILSGTFSVVGARHGGNWVHLATFLNLGSVVVGSVAFTVGLTEFPLLTYQPFAESLCKHRAEEQGYRSWGLATSLSNENQRDQERARQCQEALWVLVRMWSSTQVLLLILHSAALAIALFCFGYGLLRLCRSCWGGWKDYMAVEEADTPPAPEEPGKDQNPA